MFHRGTNTRHPANNEEQSSTVWWGKCFGITEIWWRSWLQPGNQRQKNKTKQWELKLLHLGATGCNQWILRTNARASSMHLACLFVSDCHQLGRAQGSWAAVHSEIWHPLRVEDSSEFMLVSAGAKHKFREGRGASDVYFLCCKLA